MLCFIPPALLISAGVSTIRESSQSLLGDGGKVTFTLHRAKTSGWDSSRGQLPRAQPGTPDPSVTPSAVP